jgi:mRNA interferase MazF
MPNSNKKTGNFEDDRLIQATLTVVVIPFTTNLKMQHLPTCVLVPAGEGGLRQDFVLSPNLAT